MVAAGRAVGGLHGGADSGELAPAMQHTRAQTNGTTDLLTPLRSS
jgi:hypothetical protein